jgi:hypothetical protein
MAASDSLGRENPRWLRRTTTTSSGRAGKREESSTTAAAEELAKLVGHGKPPGGLTRPCRSCQPRTSKVVSMASVNGRLKVAVASSMAQPGAAESFMPGGATTSMRRPGARISTWGSAVSR